MFDVYVKINSDETELTPSAAYREALQGAKQAIRNGMPVHIGFTIDGKTYNYDTSNPHQRAWAALWADVALGHFLKDIEPEGYLAAQLVNEVQNETLPKRYTHNEPEGVPVDSLPGSPYYEAEANLRSKLAFGFIDEHAQKLIDAYETAFNNNSKQVEKAALYQFECSLGLIGLALRWSHMHRDELRHRLFSSYKAAFGQCDEGLKSRVTELLRTM